MNVSATDTGKQDGRTLRSERTRRKIIASVIALVKEGSTQLRTGDIAARAGISVRSIFQHFPDLEALYLAVADEFVRDVVSELRPVVSVGPTDRRVDLLIEERARVNELVMPMRPLAARFEAVSDAAAKHAQFGRELQRRRTEAALATELLTLSDGERRLLLDAIQAATDWESWIVLRKHSKLDFEQASAVWKRIAHALVADALRRRAPASVAA